MKAKRIICGILALAMAVPMASCGKKKTTADGSELREITWFTEISVGEDSLWDTAEVLKVVVEKTGIRPKIITGGKEKLNMLIASGDMPDMITFDPANGTTMGDLISEGGLFTIHELDERFEPGLLEEIPEVVRTQAVNRDDGKLYGLPGFFVTGEGKLDGPQAFNVRADIYKELGEPDMTTVEGFIGALKAFKEKYPTINGKPSIALDMNMQCWSLYLIERSFGIYDNFCLTEDGTVTVKWRDPRYRDVVKFMSRFKVKKR